MPQEIEIDGEKKTVYFEDEVKPFKEGSEEATKHKEVITKLQAELGLQEGETIEDKIKELKESVNPHFREVRNINKNLVKAIKDRGIEIDDQGRIITDKHIADKDEIKKLIDDGIAKGISSATLKINKDGALNSYSAEDRSKLEPVLDKLMALGGTAEENLELAEAKVFPGRSVSGTKRVYNAANGGGVKVGGDKEDFSNTPEAKSLGQAMGLSSYKEKKS